LLPFCCPETPQSHQEVVGSSGGGHVCKAPRGGRRPHPHVKRARGEHRGTAASSFAEASRRSWFESGRALSRKPRSRWFCNCWRAAGGLPTTRANARCSRTRGRSSEATRVTPARGNRARTRARTLEGRSVVLAGPGHPQASRLVDSSIQLLSGHPAPRARPLTFTRAATAQLGHLALDPERGQAHEPRADAAVEGGNRVDLAVVDEGLDLHVPNLGREIGVAETSAYPGAS
jgi:hypothetical protein